MSDLVRQALIAAGKRKESSTDPYWNNVVLAMHGDEDPYWNNVVLSMHADEDPYWGNVVLAMHMDGADNGTTFTDEKGKTVTRFGNTVTKTATKKFGTASAYFDGTGDYLSLVDSADFDLSSSDFTIDFWSKEQASAPGYSVLSKRTDTSPDSSDRGYIVNAGLKSNGNLVCSWQQWNTGGTYSAVQGEVVGVEGWHYYAVTCLAGTIRCFIDGVLVATGTRSVGNSTNQLFIGRDNYSDTNARIGYIDDLRITKGVARYTADFTPPTRAFSNLVFLEEKGKTVTAVGNSTISTAVKKFGVGSLYFDGNGDYLSVPNSTDFNFGSGNFTMECWVNPAVDLNSGTTTQKVILGKWNTVNFSFLFRYYVGVLRFASSGSTTLTDGSVYCDAVVDLTAGTWYHLAVVRSGANFVLYVNGTSLGTVTANIVPTSTTPLLVGGKSDSLAGEYWNGYIDDLRITKGVARYTADFTPPTKSFANAMFLDEKGKIVTAVGNTTISTAVKKFGVGSMYFDGDGDYLSFDDSSDWDMGSGDFTIETFVNPTVLTQQGGIDRRVFTITDSIRSCQIWLSVSPLGAAQVAIYYGSQYRCVTNSPSSAVPTLEWSHIAFSKNGNTHRFFINGVVVDSVIATTAMPTVSYKPYIGYSNNSGVQGWWYGHIDEFRITKGIARYTTTFVPPSKSFPNTQG